MSGDLVGLVAVVMVFGIPITGIGMYTYYRVRKLCSEERLAAIARGANLPIEPELSQTARSRRAAILFIAGALGYMAAFALIARISYTTDAWAAAALGFIPLALGIGYLVDLSLIRRDLSPSS